MFPVPVGIPPQNGLSEVGVLSLFSHVVERALSSHTMEDALVQLPFLELPHANSQGALYVACPRVTDAVTWVVRAVALGAGLLVARE